MDSFKRKYMGDDEASGSRIKRKSVTLQLKLEVIHRIECGERQTDVCKDLDLAGSTVRSILKNSEKIKQCGQYTSRLGAVRLNRTRAPVIVETERLLTKWIRDNQERKMPMNLLMIQLKARSLYEDLKKVYAEEEPVEPFTASKGWFDRFRKRVDFRGNILTTDTPNVDQVAAVNFKKTFKEMVDHDSLEPHQVFSVVEIALFWKRMPARTSLMREDKLRQGPKLSNQRLMIVLSSNASGDLKMEPILIYDPETPTDLRNYTNKKIDVITKNKEESSETKVTYEIWFEDYFNPFFLDYCKSKGMPEKALVITEDVIVDSGNDTIKTIEIPENAPSNTQPLGEIVINMFKALYVEKMFTQILQAFQENESKSVMQHWEEYDINQAVENIKDVWNELSPILLNKSWKSIWPECVANKNVAVNKITQIQRKIVEIGQKLNMDEVELVDVQQLIDSKGDELSNEELMGVSQTSPPSHPQLSPVNLEMPKNIPKPREDLTVEGMGEAFEHLDAFMSYFRSNDPDKERFMTVMSGVEKYVTFYRHLYNEKKKSRMKDVIDTFIRGIKQDADGDNDG